MSTRPDTRSVDSQPNDQLNTINLKTLTELRAELKSRGLSSKGAKKELVLRLSVSYDQAARVRKRGADKSPDFNGKVTESSNGNKLKSNGAASSKYSESKLRDNQQKEREALVLWKHPVTVLQYSFLEMIALLRIGVYKLWLRKKAVALGLLTFLIVLCLYYVDGPHQKPISVIQKYFLWCSYWVGLGILSSVGLGTGLHTFLLYLGPHIASVTIAAYECMSVDFPEPPYPNEIVCPETGGNVAITLWKIMSKVRLEAIMWGAGTAIGELPPYFMARAARLSGQNIDDEELEELEDLIAEKNTHPEDLSFVERMKLGVHSIVQKIGFLGILACASIPNPLFDLAGITCGHFLVPFWTFFGATLIGKAIIKMHIQKLFVIFLFSEHHVESLVSLIKYIPRLGPSVQTPFKEWLTQQKTKLHHKAGTSTQTESFNLLSWIFEKVIIVMVIYFVVSIVNSMAQSYHKKLSKRLQKSGCP